MPWNHIYYNQITNKYIMNQMKILLKLKKKWNKKDILLFLKLTAIKKEYKIGKSKKGGTE